ncbi:uncharacterized protein LOC110854581 [Folsomia candida]|uniref:uncharacterized protein LOC110854581 n=1 Tax=Folsomia candida TaxID=158441 RepID=UPI000B8EF79A|nr:uncharacterized protein LOC110854581 [Folsomia candida]XP_035711143.1 uncharacterized protein LOC110854581 [Folsomia candida]
MKMGKNVTSPDHEMDEEECQIVHEKSTHIEASSPSRTCCFLCSILIQDSTPIPYHVARKVAICIPFLKNIDPDSATATNGEHKVCPVCLNQVKKVWSLHRKIVAIQAQIVTILTRARQKNRPDLTPSKNADQSNVVPPPPGENGHPVSHSPSSPRRNPTAPRKTGSTWWTLFSLEFLLKKASLTIQITLKCSALNPTCSRHVSKRH